MGGHDDDCKNNDVLGMNGEVGDGVQDESKDHGFYSGTRISSYEFHPSHWKYVILDDRPTAAKPNTPLMERFVFTDTKKGLTEENVDVAIKLLLFGPTSIQ